MDCGCIPWMRPTTVTVLPNDKVWPQDFEVQEVAPADMEAATGRFGMVNSLGRGSSADVFLGLWEDGNVAVKRLLSNEQTQPEFLQRVALLRQCQHPHVVRLLAFCPAVARSHDSSTVMRTAVRMTVLEFARHGSLSRLLHGSSGSPPPNPPLKWAHRLKILTGAAQGLHYLHSMRGHEDGVVHGRVTSMNLLVFGDYIGKIAELPLSVDNGTIVDDDSLSPWTSVYQAPETWNNETTQKSDVYSFGVVLLETLSGRRNLDLGTAGAGAGGAERNIREWVLEQKSNYRDLVDPAISAEISDKVLQRYFNLVTASLDRDQLQRTDMGTAVRALQKFKSTG